MDCRTNYNILLNSVNKSEKQKQNEEKKQCSQHRSRSVFHSAFSTPNVCIVEPIQLRFLIIAYKIFESSSASFNIPSNSESDNLRSSLRISNTATHSNTEALAVVK